MNIFYLDENIDQCVRMYVDKHVVKLILEYAQMLCVAQRKYGNTHELLYKITHQNHPCTLWVQQSQRHYKFLYDLFIATCHEYTYRYGKIHTTYTKLKDILTTIPLIPNNDWIDPPCAMPSEYIIASDTIASYRNYYKYGKTHLLKYTKREIPQYLI